MQLECEIVSVLPTEIGDGRRLTGAVYAVAGAAGGHSNRGLADACKPLTAEHERLVFAGIQRQGRRRKGRIVGAHVGDVLGAQVARDRRHDSVLAHAGTKCIQLFAEIISRLAGDARKCPRAIAGAIEGMTQCASRSPFRIAARRDQSAMCYIRQADGWRDFCGRRNLICGGVRGVFSRTVDDIGADRRRLRPIEDGGEVGHAVEAQAALQGDPVPGFDRQIWGLA